MNGLAPVGKLPRMELIPPADADVEGVFRGDGPLKNRIIYTRRTIDVQATKASAKVKTDAAGNEVWKKHPVTGEPQYPMLVKETKWRTERFVLVANETARTVKKVRNFEPTAKELEDLARREAEANFLKDFVSEAVAQGLTPAQVVGEVRRSVMAPGEDPEAVEVLHDGEEITEEVVAKLAAEAEEDLEVVEMLTRSDEGDEVGVPPGTNPNVELSDFETQSKMEEI